EHVCRRASYGSGVVEASTEGNNERVSPHRHLQHCSEENKNRNPTLIAIRFHSNSSEKGQAGSRTKPSKNKGAGRGDRIARPAPSLGEARVPVSPGFQE